MILFFRVCLFSVLLGATFLSTSVAAPAGAGQQNSFTPPATPLVACDPYFSIWSTGKQLTDTGTTHWTGKQHRLTGLVRIDGKAYRFLGKGEAKAPPLEQKDLSITPTRSIYTFRGAGIELEVEFLTPSIPYDIDLLSRPITYLTLRSRSIDGDRHKVQACLSAGGEIASDSPDQEVAAKKVSLKNGAALQVGTTLQHVLRRQGDDIRIDWGYFYLAAGSTSLQQQAIGRMESLNDTFATRGSLPETKSKIPTGPAGRLAVAAALKPVLVGESPVAQSFVLAYDDLYSIEFMGKKLRPYWRRNGLDAQGLIEQALEQQASLAARCIEFDEELMADLTQAGGERYAQIAALAYRQCFAAGKFVADSNGQPIQFCKENHSNGCIGTSDVFYPMAPQFLLFGPSLAKSFVAPFMEYAASDRWTFPFAPHDLGTYPKANGQVYGGGETSVENQMPVEESGNMLILFAAIAKAEGNTAFAERYWPQLSQWAKYLKEQGYDPNRQLCTDDFAGHLAHNVNLSAKAICGLGSFAQLCRMRGEEELAEEYGRIAQRYAEQWIKQSDDGDHFRLAFDKPGTWSQKYNLVWDQVLGLGLFPNNVLRKEMRHYRKVQNKYGLPLDNRRGYTKLDWIFWTAALTQDREDFEALVDPVYRFLGETPDRVPMTDWYETESGRRVGFTARPVVGGVFMQMLYRPSVWEKWASRDVTNAGSYAPMPRPPKIETRVEAADTKSVLWRYTFRNPGDGWKESRFDDSGWRLGYAGFGTRQTPSAKVGTVWDSSDIWIRREFAIDNRADEKLHLHLHHDEDTEVYINGVLAFRSRGYTTHYEQLPLSESAAASLKPVGNVIAIRCHHNSGGQYIDAGLVSVEHQE